MKRQKVIYFYVGLSTFVKKDIDILASKYTVSVFDFYVAADAKWKILFRFMHQLLFLLRHAVSFRLVVCQFAGYHSLLPILFAKIFRRPSLIVAGGTECMAFPSIGFGNFQRPYLRSFTRWSLKHCTHIAPKHETLWYCTYTYTNDDYPAQGIRYFIPGIQTPHTVIYNGYDPEHYRDTGRIRQNNFLTVTASMEYGFQKTLKGIDLILQLAPSFPDATFTIVGASSLDLPDTPPNVVLYPKQGANELIALYGESRFYLQLSLAEGFPNALCEAMLCECIPIGSQVFSIPEIIADTGYILQKKNHSMLQELIGKALKEYDSSRGKRARQRILEHYFFERR